MTSPKETPEINPQHIIDTLVEENKAINENRLYLMSLIRQIKAEYEEAANLWEAEKQSLTKSKE